MSDLLVKPIICYLLGSFLGFCIGFYVCLQWLERQYLRDSEKVG